MLNRAATRQATLGAWRVLFGALASAEKTLHANPGRHREIPEFELDSSQRFLARHLGPGQGAPIQ